MLIIVILSHLSTSEGWVSLVKRAFRLNGGLSLLFRNANFTCYSVMFSIHITPCAPCFNYLFTPPKNPVTSVLSFSPFYTPKKLFGRLNHPPKVICFIKSRAGSQDWRQASVVNHNLQDCIDNRCFLSFLLFTTVCLSLLYVFRDRVVYQSRILLLTKQHLSCSGCPVKWG